MWDHARSVFEKSAHKLVSQAISNGWICASNEYLETLRGSNWARSMMVQIRI
jgi:hypothetical protein